MSCVAFLAPFSEGTTFDEMNHELGRSQTTKGVWLAKAAKPEGFPTLVMDLEGTDGRERGEDDTAFEKQTALFAMAAADVLLVNMWCNDIGREVASGKPLLKTIFQVNLKVFNPRKTTLLFVIRDKSRTPLERLQTNLREDLDRIWATITKPERHVDAAFDDFFDLRFVALAHYEHAHDAFIAESAELCERFGKDPSAAAVADDDGSSGGEGGSNSSLRPRGGEAGVPVNGLVVSLREVWRAVKDNRDLDLPAHKVMVATVRCEEIAASRLAHLTSSADLAHLVAATASAAAPPGLARNLSKLAETELTAYDDEVGRTTQLLQHTHTHTHTHTHPNTLQHMTITFFFLFFKPPRQHSSTRLEKNPRRHERTVLVLPVVPRIILN